MSISIWRYSHLLLAISSSLFLIIASVTGIILAFEPISEAIEPYAIDKTEKVSLSQTISVLQEEYDEVLTLEVDANYFVMASVITKEGDSELIYVNPATGEKLGKPRDKAIIFEFARNLHRSLFLKSIGRFFVGFISFLLCLIVVTGIFLIIKRQGGIKRFFSKVHKEYLEQQFHVILSRWFLLPILIIATTGVYLSAEKFSLLPSTTIKHDINNQGNGMVKSPKNKASIFETTLLTDVRKVSFPFSDEEEDYYQIELKDKELLVNQYSRVIVSEINYPFTMLAARLSFVLHTGEGSILWSIILLLASCSILFFIYSGFIMTLRRYLKKVNVSLSDTKNKDECEYIILVGSETGSTFGFARMLYNALIEEKQSVFMTELNAYTHFKRAKYIVVLTATYGDGEATTNSRKFEKLCNQVYQNQEIRFSVVGFGSFQYPKYCQYAIKVDALLHGLPTFKPLLPLYKINEQSVEAFQDWAQNWSNQLGISLKLKTELKKAELSKTKLFKIKERSRLNEDDTFLIRIKPKKRIKFESGDLLSIQPKKEEKERLYSVARMGNDILLCVKKHDLGLCSSFLSQLNVGDSISARVKNNTGFHFPNYNTSSSVEVKKSVILIANGTGIAPFLGMLDQNTNCIATHLFWGGRTRDSFALYKDIIEDVFLKKKLSSFTIAYSQEGRKEYVQDLILKKSDLIARELELGGNVLICGSLLMQNDVLEILEKIVQIKLNRPLSDFENKNQIKTDCY